MNASGSMVYHVSVARCNDYDPAGVNSAITECMAPFGGISSIVNTGDRVLIKINLLAAAEPSRAVTTHPVLVKAIVDQVMACGGIPLIGDSPGGRNTPQSYQKLLQRTGIARVIAETGCNAVYFDDPRMTVSSDRARTFRKLTVSGILDDVDTVICIPKLKTHLFTYFTGAVKLLYGYIPGIMKAEYHLHAGRNVETFAELLLDIHDTFPPAFSIMDAVVGMEGSGPQNGRPRHIGLVLGSNSCTALDVVASSIVGIDPSAIPTIRVAAERGCGPGSLDDIHIHGPQPSDVRVANFLHAETMDISRIPPLLFSIAQRIAAARPVIRSSSCIHCGTCAEDCPPHAINQVKGSVPTIDYSRCIRCFCCHELCPAGAISVKTPLIRKLIG